MNSLEFLVPVSFFALVYGIFHLFIRRKERLALIEKGVTASIFNKDADVSPSLKYGIFSIGIAIGFLMGEFLYKATTVNEGVAYLSMIFLFGGAALIVYYIIGRKNLRKE